MDKNMRKNLQLYHKIVMKYQDIKKIVLAYKLRLNNAGIPVKNIYLFGSAAKKTMNYSSDIDLCIVSSKFGKKPHDERLLLMKLQKGVSDLIEPHPYSPEDFANSYDPLLYQIKKTGVKIT